MSIPEPLQFTVGDLIRTVKERKPQDHANLRRTLRIILSAVATAASQDVESDVLDDEGLDALAQSLPASNLLDCLDKKDKWSPWLIEAVPSLTAIKAYRDDYRRCFVRCLDHAAASRLISRSARGVAPAWQQARAQLLAALPYNKETLQERLDAGETAVFGHSLVEKAFKTTQNFFRTFIDAFNDMGRHMTSLGIDHPRDVRPAHFYGTPSSWHAHRVRSGTAGLSMYWRGHLAWDVLKQLEPGWSLVDFPEPGRERVYGIPEQELPPLGKQLLEAISKNPDLKPAIRRHIREHLCRLFGVLHNKLNLDVYALCRGLDDERDLALVLLAGYPPSPDGRDPDPEEELRRLFDDPGYLEEVVDSIANTNRRHAHKAVCRTNPVLLAYKRWLLERGVAANLEVGLKTFRIIGDRYLQVHATQKEWLNKLIKDAVKARKESPPSARARRKQALSGSPELWLELVAARPRLTAHTERLRQKMEAILADPNRTPVQRRHAQEGWAIAARDELMVGFLLAFQLRKENIQGMRTGHEIFPADYRVSIPPNKAKARDWINRHFPEEGPFKDLMGQLDLYLAEARSILLAGRPETPYLFLSIPKGREARDSDGHLRMCREQLAVVLRKVRKKHFADVLPPGVDLLHPHLLRDIFAGHAYRTPGGVMLAAQGLANTPGVVNGHYVQLSRQNDHEVRTHLENLDVTGKPPSRQKRLQGRKALREDLKKLFPDEPAHKIEEAIRLAERSA